MNNETSNVQNPVGLYHHEASNTYIGMIDPAQADAAVRLGYKLVKEGTKAAMLSEKEIQAKLNGATNEPKPEPVEESELEEETK